VEEQAKDRLLNGLFPPRCFVCRRLTSQQWCATCRTDLQPVAAPLCDRCGAPADDPLCRWCTASPPAFDRARSVYEYSGSVRGLIASFKYRGYRSLARPLADALCPLAEEAIALGGEVIVPVPSDPIRRWRRGFDPSGLIALELARRTGTPLQSGALRRRPGGRPQVGQPRAARLVSVRNRFYAQPETLSGCRVVLVDDVFTTGATCSEAAGALKLGGAAEVTAITLARD
jgi:ComF family protein